MRDYGGDNEFLRVGHVCPILGVLRPNSHLVTAVDVEVPPSGGGGFSSIGTSFSSDIGSSGAPATSVPVLSVVEEVSLFALTLLFCLQLSVKFKVGCFLSPTAVLGFLLTDDFLVVFPSVCLVTVEVVSDFVSLSVAALLSGSLLRLSICSRICLRTLAIFSLAVLLGEN